VKSASVNKHQLYGLYPVHVPPSTLSLSHYLPLNNKQNASSGCNTQRCFKLKNVRAHV